MATPALTMYFDGDCPFCRTETDRIRRWDRAGKLAFVDISAPGFDPSALNLSMADFHREVISRTSDGTLLAGIDTIWAVYSLVGRGWLVWPLGVPGVRTLFARPYHWFARNRYTLSRVLGYRAGPPCRDGVCFRSVS